MAIGRFVVPGCLWLWLCWHLHFEWTLNPQYNYGWAVPVLALFLAWQRWQTRPAKSAPVHLPTAAIALLLLLLPVRLIEEANPDWRLLSWAFALVVVAYSLVQIGERGGVTLVRHFAFPICFILAAVPWLVQVELAVVQGFTRAVTRVAVEIASWSGLAAYQLGNVIQLRNGFVGVDEACSGVRTLQAAIMVTLFFGELLRLTAKRRVLLVAVGCLWVFFCNICRATALVTIAGFEGLTALERSHDFIGWILLLSGTGGLLLFAWLLRPRIEEAPPLAAVGELRSISLVEIVAGCAWIATVFSTSEAWYRSHERSLVARVPWQIVWPAGSTPLPIPETTRAMLRFNSAQSAAWRDDTGAQWWGFFSHWNAGRAALQLVRSHSPDICLPAIGRRFVRELPPTHSPLAFRTYEFEQNGQPLFVFVCVQDDKAPATATARLPEWSARGRLLAVAEGRRNPGQRLLELAVIGLPDENSARAALRRTVPAIVADGAFTD